MNATVPDADASAEAPVGRRARRGLLREPSDAKTLAFVGVYFLVTGVAFLAHPQPWFVTVPLMVVASLFSFACAVITHNTIHCPVFWDRRLNKGFQLVLTLAYGHPVSAFVPGHNLSHHLHTQTRRDVMRTTKLRFRWNLLNQLLFLPVLASDITKADLAYAKAMHAERPRWFRQWVTEWVVMIAVIGGLLLVDWQATILFVLIPHAFAAWGIVGINFVQHDGCDADHPYNHSRNLTGAPINWFLFNNGYHAMHHEKPGLHWSKLPEAHAREIAPHNHDALDQPSLLAYAWRAYVSPGIRVDYLGRPVVLPEEGPDESWIPDRGETPEGVSLGAES